MANLSPLQYAKILHGLTKGSKKDVMESLVLEYVKFLQKEQMLSRADRIIDEFQKYSKKQEGIEQVDIISAVDLSQELVNHIVDQLQGQIELHTEVNESMLGGVILKVGNTLLDGSIKGQLEELKQAILEE